MRQQKNDTDEICPRSPRVETLRPARFAEACGRLAAEVREDFGQWHIVVGIARGGLHMLPWFITDGVSAFSIGMRRRTTAGKQGLIGHVISKMPEKVCDFLRKTESRLYGLMERGAKESDSDSSAPPTADALPFELFLKLWRRGRGEEAPGPVKVLIVDDAADSGSTLRKATALVSYLLPDAYVATAVLTATRDSGNHVVDYALYRDHTLLRFPWAPDYRPLEGEIPLSTMRLSSGPFSDDLSGEERELVVCDLDGTLVATNSFTRFVAWLLRAVPRLTPKILYTVASRKLRRITHSEAKQRILGLVEGQLTPEQIERWCVSLLDEYGREWVIETLRHYRKKGIPAVLATAAPSLYASVIARLCEIDYCVATERGGDECVGERKLARVRFLAETEESRPALFFSDHEEDLPLARWIAGMGGNVIWCW